MRIYCSNESIMKVVKIDYLTTSKTDKCKQKDGIFYKSVEFPEMTFNRNTCNELYPLTRPQKKNVSPHAPRIVDIKN